MVAAAGCLGHAGLPILKRAHALKVLEEKLSVPGRRIDGVQEVSDCRDIEGVGSRLVKQDARITVLSTPLPPEGVLVVHNPKQRLLPCNNPGFTWSEGSTSNGHGICVSFMIKSVLVGGYGGEGKKVVIGCSKLAATLGEI